MRGLHGSDDVKFSEELEIAGFHDLGVLDAIAAVSRAIGFQNGRKSIQRDAICAIADGVKAKLKSCAVALDGHLFQPVGIDFKNSRGAGVVRVWCEHRGSSRTERTIHN